MERVSELLAIGRRIGCWICFCGLGNFTLALARQAREVVGVEGDTDLVEWARRNATLNRVENAQFHTADLTGTLEDQLWLQGGYDRILLDPPRSGAGADAQGRDAGGAARGLRRHPATLARDVGELVHRFGYRLESAWSGGYVSTYRACRVDCGATALVIWELEEQIPQDRLEWTQGRIGFFNRFLSPTFSPKRHRSLNHGRNQSRCPVREAEQSGL